MEIRIELKERRPPAGRVWVSGGGPVRFAGWLALLALLERLLAEDVLVAAADGLGDELDAGAELAQPAGGEAGLAQPAGDLGADGAS